MEALKRRVSNRCLPHEPDTEGLGALERMNVASAAGFGRGAPLVAQSAGHFSAGNLENSKVGVKDQELHDAQLPHDYYDPPRDSQPIVVGSQETLAPTLIEGDKKVELTQG